MTTEQRPKFEFEADPDKLVEARLADGELVEGSQLAQFLREWGDKPLPDRFRSLLCDFLEGRIKKKRGRKTVAPLTRLVKTSDLRLIYRAYWLALQGHCKAPGKPPCHDPAKNPFHDEKKYPEYKPCTGPCETRLFVEKHRERVDKSLSKHEQAACFTSIYYYSHPGHYRTILNKISSQKNRRIVVSE
jgi:hypothetical protein